MKYYFRTFIAATFLFLFIIFPSITSANSSVSVKLDNNLMVFEVDPFIKDGSTMVQFRPIFEKFGLTVTWNNSERTVMGVKDGLIILLKIDDNSAIVNGKSFRLEVAPTIVQGVTFVPLRFIGEASGNLVNWNDDTRTVTINTVPVTTNSPQQPKSENQIIQEISKRVKYSVVDGIDPNNSLKLKSTEAAMGINLDSASDLTLFKELTDTGKRKFINNFVQIHWGDVLGVSHCYTYVNFQNTMYAFADISYQVSDDKISGFNFYPDGYAKSSNTSSTINEDQSIQEINKRVKYSVIDGIDPNNSLKLKPTEAAMLINLDSAGDLSLFKILTDAGKKKFINNFVQTHWGDVLGVSHCYTYVNFQNTIYAFADISYQISDDKVSGFIFYPDGYVNSNSNNLNSNNTSTLNTSPTLTKQLSLYSNDGKTYLGILTSNELNTESIFSKYGSYGSEYSSTSIWNDYGTYGSEYSNESAFNKYATKPPIIIMDGKIVGYLTVNTTITGGVSPIGLKEWLKSNGY